MTERQNRDSRVDAAQRGLEKAGITRFSICGVQVFPAPTVEDTHGAIILKLSDPEEEDGHDTPDPATPEETVKRCQIERISQATRDSIRETVVKMQEAESIPAEEFSGHKGIFLANLEGYLGRYPLALLTALEEAESLLSKALEAMEDETGPPRQAHPRCREVARSIRAELGEEGEGNG